MAEQKNILDNILSDDHLFQIEKMIEKFNKNKNIELEVSFKKITYLNYVRISKIYINATDEQNISSHDSLDISIILPDKNTYRISILDADLIQEFIQNFSKTKIYDIQQYLLRLTPNENIEIMYKDRGSADKLYIDDIDAFIKLTTEIALANESSKPKLNGDEKMLFRYKNRYSFNINKNVRIDITDVQESNSIVNLANRFPNYEIEMEFVSDKINLDIFLKEMSNALKIVQDTQVPIGKQEALDIISKYKNLLNIKIASHLDSRNVISIETQHIIKFIPNKYAITDKADGERYFLFSIENGVYLLSINLSVKKLNIQINNKKFYNMLLDGELINNNRGHMFMAFDVVYANSIDYRTNNKYTLTKRIIVLNNIIDECFGNLIPFTNYADKYDDLEFIKIKDFISVN